MLVLRLTTLLSQAMQLFLDEAPVYTPFLVLLGRDLCYYFTLDCIHCSLFCSVFGHQLTEALCS